MWTSGPAWVRRREPAEWQRATRDARWKLIVPGDKSSRLYDLETDPTERTNVASSFPSELERLMAEIPT